ncbi:MAG: translation initiation factor IF-2 subunit beta [Methanomicrobium sp.]|jgi:translation initiation factor 2 subunit 2|uniref:translation initiation factor IF-2 subunit beta n=1 Tax=Methanomicrobium mobile TaxID=2205 RepID=UPI0005B26B07|nr:translation initiation factor IF-2 subunit beta [Methanomicrobium mobile]MBO7388508.1 translation initiation factor IF-2 subunit beta [Methanomicrobium sp.]MBP5083604.1 translation initiation factor IF-2 subunit beta [Methanomicrobium sp.]
MTDPYEALLKHAYTNITEKSGDEGRFIVPEARVFVEGKTTVIENFSEIVSVLRREPDGVLKYLCGELGTAGKIDSSRAVFNGKFDKQQIGGIIGKYIEDYVICSECGKPDTRLVKEGRTITLKCDACGGHRPIRKRKAKTENISEQVEEGMEMEVDIQFLSKRGDGVAKIGKYTLYVTGTKPGQRVKVRITRVAGMIVFTEKMV